MVNRQELSTMRRDLFGDPALADGPPSIRGDLKTLATTVAALSQTSLTKAEAQPLLDYVQSQMEKAKQRQARIETLKSLLVGRKGAGGFGALIGYLISLVLEQLT